MPVFGDEVGMFWEEQVIETSRRGIKKDDWKPGALPKAGYKPPTSFKSIKGLPRIGLDIETYDPNLLAMGSGAHRQDGKIVGVAVAYAVDDPVYYPTAHANVDRCIANPEKFYAQLRAEAVDFEGEIVGANLMYDLDWLWKEQGVQFKKALLRDVQIAEPLLDENKRTYNLESLGIQYVKEGKFKNVLTEVYGKDYIKHMDMVDPGHAAAYAEGDTTLPWRILDLQLKALENQGLLKLYDMESRLTPLLVQMRQHGVRIDTEKAETALDWMKSEGKKSAAELTRETGLHVDVWSGDSVAKAFDSLDIPYLKTKAGNASFRKDWLAAHPSKIAQLIVQQREYDKIGGTFINNYLLEGHVNGRIHCNFNQLRSDQYGTVSGRFSSSNPNLQNIPVRHPVMGPLLRSMFIPEEGTQWGSADWSQIEYRFLVHYAHISPGIDATSAVRMYREDNTTDFHNLAAEITGVPRKQAKNVNFGVVYGMGVKTMAKTLNCTLDEANAMLEIFHGNMPFMKALYDMATTRATRAGFIRTILGRRRRFEKWEYKNQLYDTRELAQEAYVASPCRWKPRRAQTHKALNSLLQGSAADLMKQAMVEMYEGGVFDILVPHITVHDEMNVSVPKTAIGAEAFAEMGNIMETTMKLEVPIYADSALGANWSEAK